MCRKCVSEEMANKIELVDTLASDESDGVFWGICSEHGVEAEDLEAYHREHKEKKNAKK